MERVEVEQDKGVLQSKRAQLKFLPRLLAP